MSRATTSAISAQGRRRVEPDPRSDRAAAVGLAAAYPAFAAIFRGPRSQFWSRMTRTGLALGGLALVADPAVRPVRWRRADVAAGVGIAAGLYGVFTVGDGLARRIMPAGNENIAEVYALRTLRPKAEIAARLAAIVGPAEELFWRGLLQRALTRRLGRWRGAAAATAAYSSVHLITGNPTLVGAAGVGGAAWSALAAFGVPMPALVTSHVAWDIWIFLLAPTGPTMSE